MHIHINETKDRRERIESMKLNTKHCFSESWINQSRKLQGPYIYSMHVADQSLNRKDREGQSKKVSSEECLCNIITQ